jgi:hypothetical protein
VADPFGTIPAMDTATATATEAVLARYTIHFSGCVDEVDAECLDEACDIAESLTPSGQYLLLVEGPDGCRVQG